MANPVARITRPMPVVHYPSSDGKPMGETGIHVRAILHLFEVLDALLKGKQVYLAADMFLYYVRGDPRAVKAPDVMVIKGVATHERKSYKLWVEKKVPNVIFEITSQESVAEDLGSKREVYEGLGVKEYFVFDPEALHIDPPLQGFRLKGGAYVPLKPGTDGSLACKELGLRVVAEGRLLRLIDARTGELLLSGRELQEQEKQRAEQEKQRAEQEKQRADQEKQRADALAAEVERLTAELAQQKPSKK